MSEAPDDVAVAVAALKARSIDELRGEWRSTVRAPPPRVQSRDLMRRLLAERIQLAAFGADLELDRQLRALSNRYERRATQLAPDPELKVGAVIWRQHGGERHRVDVLDSGFRWKDLTYRSLSHVARAITGTRWNGPKFFGLRERDA